MNIDRIDFNHGYVTKSCIVSGITWSSFFFLPNLKIPVLKDVLDDRLSKAMRELRSASYNNLNELIYGWSNLMIGRVVRPSRRKYYRLKEPKEEWKWNGNELKSKTCWATTWTNLFSDKETESRVGRPSEYADFLKLYEGIAINDHLNELVCLLIVLEDVHRRPKRFRLKESTVRVYRHVSNRNTLWFYW